jgi:hypothetical protein
MEIHTEKLPFDVAREALTVIKFFQVSFSSGPDFQHIFEKTLLSLRPAARNAKMRDGLTSTSDHKFLMIFADALEQSNKPGVYSNPFGVEKQIQQ